MTGPDRPYAAIILAAGYSSRMGRIKALLPLGETTVLERVIRLFRRAGVADVCVVVGHGREQLAPLASAAGARVVVNPDFSRGMFTSIQAGVAGLPPAIRGFFVQPVDIPLVEPETVRALIRAQAQGPGRVIHPCYQGRRGHPPLVPMSLGPRILEWNRDGGLRAVLAEYAGNAVNLDVPDEHVVFDMDTPEDYQEMLARHRRPAD